MDVPTPLPPLPDPFRRGEYLVVSASGRSIDAFVAFASENGRSLILLFDGMLGGYAGMLPALCHDCGQWLAIVDGMPLALARKERDQ